MKDEGKYDGINDILAKYGIKPFSESGSPEAEEKDEVGIEEPTPYEPVKEEKKEPGIPEADRSKTLAR